MNASQKCQSMHLSRPSDDVTASVDSTKHFFRFKYSTKKFNTARNRIRRTTPYLVCRVRPRACERAQWNKEHEIHRSKLGTWSSSGWHQETQRNAKPCVVEEDFQTSDSIQEKEPRCGKWSCTVPGAGSGADCPLVAGERATTTQAGMETTRRSTMRWPTGGRLPCASCSQRLECPICLSPLSLRGRPSWRCASCCNRRPWGCAHGGCWSPPCGCAACQSCRGRADAHRGRVEAACSCPRTGTWSRRLARSGGPCAVCPWVSWWSPCSAGCGSAQRTSPLPATTALAPPWVC